jgi:hypothetical protein
MEIPPSALGVDQEHWRRVHDVVRIDEAGNHEERSAASARPGGGGAQPADALTRNEGIVDKAALRTTADVARRTKIVKPVWLKGGTVIYRLLDLEELLVHLELAEVGGLVTELSQHRTDVEPARAETRHKVVLHLIVHTINLGRPTS